LTAVGFVGLGAMGSRMALRLLEAGNDLTVWNRTAEKSEPLVRAGAVAARTPAEAAAGSELVITMVSDPEALAAVTGGPDGLHAGVGTGKLLVEMSTVGPGAVRELAAGLPAGARMVDAPVLGSLTEIEEGSLRIFAGGDGEDVERAQPTLAVLGEVVHVGPLGSGAAAKLVANLTLVGTLSLLGEAVALGEALGLETDVVFDTLGATPLASQADRRRKSLEAGTFERRFGLELAAKDAALVAAAGAGNGLELRVAEAARAWFELAEKEGWGELDYSAVLAFMTGRPRPG
jgi:3-hydroxyisobutyrate dehydrogenase-like beta-hydroxyacid dehydrogenase